VHKLVLSIVVGVLVGVPAVVQALTCQFSWDRVTTRVNGEAVTVDGYRLYKRTGETVPWQLVKGVQGAATIQSDAVCQAGEQWVVRAFLGSLESENSNIVVIPVPPSPPGAPANFKVIIVIGVQ
jgi:hypothetical protein